MLMRSKFQSGLLFALALALGGCKIDLRGAKEASAYRVHEEPVPAIQVPAGFRVTQVAEGFNYPSSMAWDAQGRLYVLESHTVPIPTLKPKVLRVGPDSVEEIPWTGDAAPTGGQAVGLAFSGGWLYVSHEEKDGTWGITRFRPDGGATEAVLRGIPARGDHWINYLLFDREGNLWFGVGSATNSGVVSSHDPVNGKWIKKRPDAHDIACRDLVLTGQVFTDADALASEKGARARTGVYQSYRHAEATRIPAEPSCTGALYRLAPGSRSPELFAWGFRNPVALAEASDGTILVGMHGADIRGTRPVMDDPDAVYRLRKGAWYGWPDFAADLLPITDAKHRPPPNFLSDGRTALSFVLDHAASGLTPPDRSLLVAATEPHAALGGMTVVPVSGPFSAFAGRLLLSEMGDFKPTTDAVHPDVHAGFQVESVDTGTGAREVFARNRGTGAALPASVAKLERGFERPVDVKFGPDGLLYVLDFGLFTATEKSAKVFPKTGKVFRIEPAVPRPPG
ncbi:MAG: hypothetical protein PT977_14210 [Acidobacteriota bacterium]|nr:hypothetical protein [Acidobacteriota bacterium]